MHPLCTFKANSYFKVHRTKDGLLELSLWQDSIFEFPAS